MTFLIVSLLKITKMEATKILDASLLDILFENRNKDYGAYQLRKNYKRQLISAILLTLVLATLFSIIALHGKKIPNNISIIVPETITIKTIQQPKPKIVLPKPPKPATAPRIQVTKFTILKVLNDKLVPPDEVPPKQTTTNLNIGAFNQKGLNKPGLLATPREIKGFGDNGKGLGNSSGDGNAPFVTVQVKAQFPGGEEAWRRYLERNLRQEIPVENGAPSGMYAVTVSFLVNAKGDVSEVKVLNAPTPDFGISAEAIRVIAQGPKWIPAIQNGRYVAFRQTQRIVFQVQQE